MLTYQDYCHLPEDHNRYEILEGDLAVTPSPATVHQTISKRIQLAFMLQIEARNRGTVFNAPVDVIFNDNNVAQPDLLVLSPQNRNRISQRGIEGAPDLIVEILSPSTADRDRNTKLKLYAKHGVREYWIVDPKEHTISIHTLIEGRVHQVQHFGRNDKVTSLLFELNMEIDPIFAPQY